MHGSGELTNASRLRHRKYNLESGSDDPLTAALMSTFGGLGNVFRGLAGIGLEPAKAVRLQNEKNAVAASEAGPSNPRKQLQTQDFATSTSKAKRTGTQDAIPETVPTSSSVSEKSSARLQAPSASRDSSPSSQFHTEEERQEGEEEEEEEEGEEEEEEEAFNATLPTSAEKLRPRDVHLQRDAVNIAADSAEKSSINSSKSRSLNMVGSAAKGVGVGLVKGTSLAVLHAATTPLDVIAATTRGLHNAPKLYGDDTVRPIDRINGFGSGMKVAGKVSYPQPFAPMRDTALTI